MRLSTISTPVLTLDHILICGLASLQKMLSIFNENYLDDADEDVQFFYYDIQDRVDEIEEAVRRMNEG